MEGWGSVGNFTIHSYITRNLSTQNHHTRNRSTNDGKAANGKRRNGNGNNKEEQNYMIGKISSGFINEKRSGYKNILSSGRRGRDGYGLLTRNGNFPPRIGTGAF